MSFPKYPAYKDSGVEWIGDIPVGWQPTTFKTVLVLNDGGVWGSDPDGQNDCLVLRSTDQTIDGQWEIKDPAQRKLVAKERENHVLEKGDLLITKSSGSEFHIGKTTIVDENVASLKACFSNFMQRLRVNNYCNPFFFWYVLNSPVARDQFFYLSNSTIGLANLSASLINNSHIPLPPLPEQQAIASFLDRECGKIDALIAEQERLIALLAEKRQGVISHAVTKGLNPNVPMKDSGIPWIGMVPEGWDYSRLRFVAQFNPSKTEISYLPLNEEISFLPMEAIGDDGTINLEQKRKISDVQNGYTYFRDMDIVFAKITPCFENGKGAVVKGLLRGVGFGTTELIVARSVPSRVIPEYLFLFFQSDIFRKPAEASMYGAGGQKRVSERFVRDFSISLPPLPEQQAIASFLDLECRKIDTLIAEQKAMLALCKERRAALISAAVTGKIDVRAQSKARAA
ncbi:restriction endonuclease subunit S [Novacetimonas hansenii]|uniref:restriction endonuclease subunit S n=1 Tax=Novacetimonas hansenii TaxID=436 RepID=UPI00094FF7C8|nr:restriction endonuclease subunit S [Novacetimonas hansenii]